MYMQYKVSFPSYEHTPKIAIGLQFAIFRSHLTSIKGYLSD